MLHAALIGLPSTGKSTLFQLMTSAKDAPRGHGKTETAVGISKVPDERLDRLTAMYNPRKRVPATIEFTDIVAPGRTGAATLVDVAGYKNADALVHVVRAFRDESVPHPSGSIDPRARRAGDGRRAHPRRPRRGRAAHRAARARSEEEQDRRAREESATCCCAARKPSKTVSRCGRSASPATICAGCEGFSSSRPSRCCS